MSVILILYQLLHCVQEWILNKFYGILDSDKCYKKKKRMEEGG